MKTRLLLPAVFPFAFASPAPAQLSNVPAWDVIDPPAGSAMTLRDEGASYIRRIEIARPRAATTAAELSSLNANLPVLLPGFETLMESAELSSRYKDLYDLKIRNLREGKLLTAHNFFDCETVLRLEHPVSKRKVLLLQADMDVVTDGSDPVRAGQLADYDLARSSDWFLPETSYSWTKNGGPANPFLDYYPGALEKLQQLRAQIEAEGEADQGVIWRELLASCDAQIHRVKVRGLGNGTKNGLVQRRFLLAERDPFVVLPVPWVNKDAAWSPHIGDYAAVVYKDRIYPAVLGDSGPSDKVGEASLRLARELNPGANGRTRAVSDLTVTYLYFPQSATPRREPDLALWRSKVLALLHEIGGISDPAVLHDWMAELK